MTRYAFQQGYVSDPIRTRRGTVYKIRYRVPAAGGKFKHRKETLYGLNGKKAARAVLNERLQQAGNMNPEAADLTLRSFAETYWKSYLDRKQVKPSTMKGYQSVLAKHIYPALGGLGLTAIAPINVEELLQSKAKKGYSPKTMRNIVVLLQGIFHLAEDNDLIAKSPIRDRHKPICRNTEKPAWSREQVRSILEEVPDAFRCLFTCIALTGVRLGELLALQWKHIDLQSKRLRIEQSLWNGQIVSPKTPWSVRPIPLGDFLAQLLEYHRQISLFTSPDDFVFCRKDGASLNPDVLRKDVLYPTLDRLNIPRPKGASGFHAFRHSAASLINAETGNLKLTQKFLGHSDVNTTANIYTHTSESMEREAAVVLEKAIFGNLFPVVPNLGTGNRKLVN
jgi:integrase